MQRIVLLVCAHIYSGIFITITLIYYYEMKDYSRPKKKIDATATKSSVVSSGVMLNSNRHNIVTPFLNVEVCFLQTTTTPFFNVFSYKIYHACCITEHYCA